MLFERTLRIFFGTNLFLTFIIILHFPCWYPFTYFPLKDLDLFMKSWKNLSLGFFLFFFLSLLFFFLCSFSSCFFFSFFLFSSFFVFAILTFLASVSTTFHTFYDILLFLLLSFSNQFLGYNKPTKLVMVCFNSYILFGFFSFVFFIS